MENVLKSCTLSSELKFFQEILHDLKNLLDHIVILMKTTSKHIFIYKSLF